VRELLKLAARGERPCEEVDKLVTRHLETTERKIEALRRLRRELRDTLASWVGALPNAGSFRPYHPRHQARARKFE